MCAARSSPTTTPTGTWTRSLLRARLIAGVPADLIGSLTGLTEARFPVRGACPLRGRPRRAPVPEARAPRRERRQRDRVGRHRALDRHLHQRRRAGDRRERRRDRDGRAQPQARPPRRARGRLRQPLHLRAAREDERRARRSGTRVRGGVVARSRRRRGGRRRRRTWSSRFGRPAAARRGSTRSRSSTAGSCSRPPRSTAPTARTCCAAARRSARSCCSRRPSSRSACSRTSASRSTSAAAPTSASGQIDRRVLATLAFLSESGLSPTVSSLRCGHSYHTKSGNVSEHSSGNAVDISRVNGIPVLGHQEPGGITDQTFGGCMQLQGAFAPHQVISLFDDRRPDDGDGRSRRPHPRRLQARGHGRDRGERAGAEARTVAAADGPPARDPQPDRQTRGTVGARYGSTTAALPPPRRTGSAAASVFPPGRNSMPGDRADLGRRAEGVAVAESAAPGPRVSR